MTSVLNLAATLRAEELPQPQPAQAQPLRNGSAFAAILAGLPTPPDAPTVQTPTNVRADATPALPFSDLQPAQAETRSSQDPVFMLGEIAQRLSSESTETTPQLVTETPARTIEEFRLTTPSADNDPRIALYPLAQRVAPSPTQAPASFASSSPAPSTDSPVPSATRAPDAAPAVTTGSGLAPQAPTAPNTKPEVLGTTPGSAAAAPDAELAGDPTRQTPTVRLNSETPRPSFGQFEYRRVSSPYRPLQPDQPHRVAELSPQLTSEPEQSVQPARSIPEIAETATPQSLSTRETATNELAPQNDTSDIVAQNTEGQPSVATEPAEAPQDAPAAERFEAYRVSNVQPVDTPHQPLPVAEAPSAAQTVELSQQQVVQPQQVSAPADANVASDQAARAAATAPIVPNVLPGRTEPQATAIPEQIVLSDVGLDGPETAVPVSSPEPVTVEFANDEAPYRQTVSTNDSSTAPAATGPASASEVTQPTPIVPGLSETAVTTEQSAQSGSSPSTSAGPAAPAAPAIQVSASQQVTPSTLAPTQPVQVVAAPDEIVSIVNERLSASAPDDRQILVQLDPPELGRVSIDFKFDGAGLQSVIVTGETPEAVRQLRNLHQELVVALEQQGLSSEDLVYQDSSNQSQHRKTPWANSFSFDVINNPADVSETASGPIAAAHNRSEATSGLDIRV